MRWLPEKLQKYNDEFYIPCPQIHQLLLFCPICFLILYVSCKPRQQVTNLTKNKTFSDTGPAHLSGPGNFPLLQYCFLTYKSGSDFASQPNNVLTATCSSGPDSSPGTCSTFSQIPLVSFHLELPQPLWLFHDTNIFEDNRPVVLWNPLDLSLSDVS